MRSQYSYKDIRSDDLRNIDVFIMGLGEDQRCMASYDRLKEVNYHIQTFVFFQYDDIEPPKVKESFPGCDIIIIRVNNTKGLLSYAEILVEAMSDKSILVDITEIHIPDLFILFKLISLRIMHYNIMASYTTPLDYVFEEEPFLSYHSFHGNLKTEEIKGYGGMSSDTSHDKMFIFLGFEGALSQKVNDDIQYQDLILVNNLPSIFAKYKDISIINNYELLKSDLSDIYYVPADNPFETYNFLAKAISDIDNVCIAPLSTKVVAFGVCLFALQHENVRVVYPTAQEYAKRHANEIHRTYIYKTDILQR